jgi:kynurenine formamidase
VFDLGMEVNESMPMGPPEAFVPFSRSFCATAAGAATAQPMEFAAEVINSTLHTGTHLDALVHVQRDGRVFGGAAETDVRTDRGFTSFGVETVAPILTRGVLLDVARASGVDALPDGYEITVADLEVAVERGGLDLCEGDAILIRTGKIRDYWEAPHEYHRSAPGVGTDAAIWLYERGMAVLGTDTAGTEPAPIPDPSRTLHAAMLVDRGVHLVENLFLDRVAAEGIREGLFVCLPIRITGATASWVRPVLVV